MEGTEKHWGEWVLKRSQWLGNYRLQRHLADAIGCTENQLSRWLQMSAPPKQMRKGFDFKLAWALKTSPEMLFKDWAKTPPEKARELIFKRSEEPGPDHFERETNRQLLEEFIEGFIFPNMTDQQLAELAASGLATLALTADKGEVIGMMIRGYDHPFLRRLKRFYAEAAKPPVEGLITDEKYRRERPSTPEEFRAFLDQIDQQNAAKLREKKP